MCVGWYRDVSARALDISSDLNNLLYFQACPDNPKGLYPKGGGCRFCGSVEHLKSECPRKSQKDARSEIRVMKQSDHRHLEDEPIQQFKPKIVPKKKQQKIVSF